MRTINDKYTTVANGNKQTRANTYDKSNSRAATTIGTTYRTRDQYIGQANALTKTIAATCTSINTTT